MSQTLPHAPQLAGEVVDDSQPLVLGAALSQSSHPAAQSRYVHRRVVRAARGRCSGRCRRPGCTRRSSGSSRGGRRRVPAVPPGVDRPGAVGGRAPPRRRRRRAPRSGLVVASGPRPPLVRSLEAPDVGAARARTRGPARRCPRPAPAPDVAAACRDGHCPHSTAWAAGALPRGRRDGAGSRALSSRHVRKSADPRRRQPVHRRARLRSGARGRKGRQRDRSTAPARRRARGARARWPTASPSASAPWPRWRPAPRPSRRTSPA